jgi:two-component system, cell cycle response regulator
VPQIVKSEVCNPRVVERSGGDDVLREFGLRMQQALRHGPAWVARLGGEEFAIVLPETPQQQACETAGKLRALLMLQPFHAQGKALNVTASFGVCGLEQVPAGEKNLAECLLQAADAALYRSKHEGRDRVTGAHPESVARRD